MAGSIGIALQGLSAAMRGFETSSNNIANVNTPGYSRQEIALSSRAAPEQGVQVIDISRVVDEFATKQLWSSSASFKSTESYAFFAGQIDDLLANPNTSISAVTDQFFSAIQTGVDDPASIPNRELILTQTEALARRFSEVDRQLQAQNGSINARLGSTVSSVNEMAGQVGALNDLIRLSDARGEAANELKDQRDQLILSISEKIGGTVQTGTGSTDINLFVGNGTPLVVGGMVSEISASQGDPDINDIEVFVSISGRQINVSDQVREGEIGGMLDFKDEVLLPAWNELGRLAIVFADTVNQQHRKGVDLDGNMGANLFKDPAQVGDVKAFSTNTTPLSPSSDVIIRDTSQLRAEDYVFKFGDNGTFTLTRSDGTVFTEKSFASRTVASPLPGSLAYEGDTMEQSPGKLRLNLDGLDITLETASGQTFAKNDKVLVLPVRTGARSIEVALSAGRELAFASPVRAEAAEENTGAAKVETVSVNPRSQLIPVDMSTALPLGQPNALVYFTDENTYSVYEDPAPLDFDLSKPLTAAIPYTFLDGSGLATGRTFDEGKGIVINGVTVPPTSISDNVGNPVEKQLKDTGPMQLVFGRTTDAGPPIVTYDSYSVYRYDLATDPDQLNPIAVSLNNTYVQGDPIQLQGFEVTLQGKPHAGDRIDLSFNTDGVSDNRNALQLSNLQQQKLVDGGSYQDNYGRLVEKIGTRTSVALINLEANETIKLSAEAIRNGVSGVNLDEEAANLIKFQQQYQAASQVISTARDLFQTLLSVSGG